MSQSRQAGTCSRGAQQEGAAPWAQHRRDVIQNGHLGLLWPVDAGLQEKIPAPRQPVIGRVP